MVKLLGKWGALASEHKDNAKLLHEKAEVYRYEVTGGSMILATMLQGELAKYHAMEGGSVAETARAEVYLACVDQLREAMEDTQ